MWVYEKKLLYPVEVGTCNPKLARYIMEQYGGADGELAAATVLYESTVYGSNQGNWSSERYRDRGIFTSFLNGYDTTDG